ncbi:MAG: HAD family hydrolase [Haloarculaceae archaeon]
MDAVAFDMDGVLVNSEDYWIELERERILPEVVPGEEVPTEEFTGIFYEELYDVLDAKYDVAVSYDRFTALYEGAAEDIYGEEVTLTRGTRELIAELRERGVPVAMVTASPPDWYETVLERFELPFDETLSVAEIDGPGKPDPAVYEAAADRLGVAPEDLLAIEDSHHGTTAAARAGATVVAFGVGAAQVATGNADLVAETPEELAEIIRERA